MEGHPLLQRLLLVGLFVLIISSVIPDLAVAFSQEHTRRRQVINAQPGLVPLKQSPMYPSPAPPQNDVKSAKNPRYTQLEDSVFLLRSDEDGAIPTENAELSPLGIASENQTSASTFAPPPSTTSSSDEPSPSTTTDAPTSTTPPTIPPSSEPPTSESPPPHQFFPDLGISTKDYHCFCDMRTGACDMNCCCDPDCTTEHKRLFTNCTASIIYDPRSRRNKELSCVKSYIMYSQHVPYGIDRKDKGLFCVVKENVKQVKEFSHDDMDRITKKIVTKKFNLKSKYGWETVSSSLESLLQIPDKPYKYDSPIWALKASENGGEEEVVLSLPSSFHTDICSLHQPVKFLDDSFSACVLPLTNLRTQCETLTQLNANQLLIKDHSVIGNPTVRQKNNATGIWKYVVHRIIPSQACHEGECISFNDPMNDENEFPKPEWLQEESLCHNVLSRLNLTFVHEGIKGITYVEAKTELRDVQLGEAEIRQEFAVDFVWGTPPKETANDTTKNSSITPVEYRKLPRSGNPGYLVGKPVILGRRVVRSETVKNETKEVTVERMQVLPDAGQWLHIQKSGDCPQESDDGWEVGRTPILFGYEHVSTCRLKLDGFRKCDELQRYIGSVVFGVDDPQGFTEPQNYYVASYGSPDVFPSDWVSLTFIDPSSFLGSLTSSSSSLSSGCDEITPIIHITIVYALVGPVDAPQAKITGVFYEPEGFFALPPSENSDAPPELSITTTVSFVDITGKPTTRVATWPVVSIRLPADFFYPFSSSSPKPSGQSGNRPSVLSFVYMSVLLLLFMPTL